MLELSKKQDEIEQLDNEIQEKVEAKKEVLKIACSPKRVISVFLFSFIASLPVVLSAEPSTLTGSDKFYTALILLLMGLPLWHSFRNGWTISKHGIVTITKDVFSFTIMQLFYGYIFCLTLLFAIARWP